MVHDPKWIPTSFNETAARVRNENARSSYHGGFRDGAEAVDENIAGDIHRRAWRRKHTESEESELTHSYPPIASENGDPINKENKLQYMVLICF